MEKTLLAYLQGLETADLSKVLECFTTDAVVFSPLYGKMEATAFYKRLFSDTQSSKTTLLDILTNPSQKTACLYFIYEWTLTNGQFVRFECADILKLNKENRIQQLKIIYDTVQAREKLGNLNDT